MGEIKRLRAAPHPTGGATVKSEAVRRAILLLRAAGVQYAVVDADGILHGNLPIKPAQKRASPKYDNQGKFGYQEKLDAAQPGDVLVFEADTEEEAESLRGSIGSRAIRQGIGVVTTKRGAVIEVMITERS